jgi:hypothetical protein
MLKAVLRERLLCFLVTCPASVQKATHERIHQVWVLMNQTNNGQQSLSVVVGGAYLFIHAQQEIHCLLGCSMRLALARALFVKVIRTTMVLESIFDTTLFSHHFFSWMSRPITVRMLLVP